MKSLAYLLALSLLFGFGSMALAHKDHDHAAESGQKAASAKTYTCPMHPEVREDKPGECPECGMKLEPATEEATTEEIKQQ
jgi:Cu+-exporting ATPase